MMCMPITDQTADPCDVDPASCKCQRSSDCGRGLLCENGRCVDPCRNVVCGPNASCFRGTCVCSPGFTGSPSDPKLGCQSRGCKNDRDCDSTEICFYQQGHRRCVDACQKVQCGHNSVCISQEHRSSCLCKDGYVPNPNDRRGGCQVEDRESKCKTDQDCFPGQVCQVDRQGLKACVDPCFSHVCGQNELCDTQNGRALCKCATGFIRNPTTKNCDSKLIFLFNDTLMD